MTGSLAERTAVVTGGATGIGLGIVRRLVADGARVLLAGRDEGEVKAGVASLAAGGHDVATFHGDLSDRNRAEQLVATAVETLGRVDILVNNAGGGVIRPTLEHTEETLRATIDNNLWTTIRVTMAVLPHMVDQGGGRIVNIGAESVRNGLTDHAIYNAAKGGVHALASGLAREFADRGITVNVVAPSYTLTPEVAEAVNGGRLSERFARVLDDAVGFIPMGRPAEVDEVAAAVAYLAGPGAGFVTGQVLSVNGGSSMG